MLAGMVVWNDNNVFPLFDLFPMFRIGMGVMVVRLGSLYAFFFSVLERAIQQLSDL